MPPHVCNWRHGYLLDNRLRRFCHRPEQMLGDYVRPAMTVLDVGCGMGFFSIAMARMVGEKGLVIAADLQPEMLAELMKRARRAGVAGRIRAHQCLPDRIGLTGPVDFALAFWMVHETPDAETFLREMHGLLKPSARLLIAEPIFHVTGEQFRATLQAARRAGLRVRDEPRIGFSRAALLERS